MTTRVHSSPPTFPVSLPPRPGPLVTDDPATMRVQTERVLPSDRAHTMPRQLRPTPAPMMPRRPLPLGREPVRPHATPMPSPVLAIVDELSDLLALDQTPASNPMRPNEFARPSWCTHEGVTVSRAGRRACLRCGALIP
jgi:hypothetical protein